MTTRRKRGLERDLEELLSVADEALSTAQRDRLAEAFELEELVPTDDDFDRADLTVKWPDAAPEHRPDGLHWRPETATLQYDLWAAQRECLDRLTDDDADLVGFLAGYGSGKSILGARWVLAQAIGYPGTRVLAMCVDFTKARDTTYRILFEQFPGDTTSGRPEPTASPLVEAYHRTDHRVEFVNGSTIVLGSGDEWNRHAGGNPWVYWGVTTVRIRPRGHDSC